MHNNVIFNLNGAINYLPQRDQVRSANLTCFPEVVKDMGGDHRRLLARHGIGARTLADNDAFIDCQALVNLFEDASACLNEPLFGLHLAARQNVDVFGCVAALVRAAPSVRAGLNAFIRYIPIAHSPMAEMTLLESQDSTEFRWQTRMDLGSNQQANYQAALLNLKIMQLIGASAFRPQQIILTTGDGRESDAEIERLLGARFTTARGYNAIAFDTTLLDRSVPTSNRLVFDLLRSYLDSASESADDLESQVLAFIRTTLADDHCTLVRCAEHLGYAPRSLQAALARMDQSFSGLVHRERVDLARNLLRLPQYSLENIAATLGYSDASSFSRAFKGWTGLTPKAARHKTVGS